MVTWFGVRRSRTSRSRRLGFKAAKLSLTEARRRQVAARVSVKVARAELARVQAEQGASRASAADVGAARRALSTAQRNAKAATADVRAQRAQVSAARAMLPQSAQQLPLERLVAEHDAVTARWLEYETDPARLIAFPALTDMRVPETAAFVTAQQHALSLRPPSDRKRVTPAEYAVYRDAVSHATRAFEVAERTAWRHADGSVPGIPDTPPPAWTAVAEAVVRRSAEALGRAADTALASMRDAAEATRGATAEDRGAYADSRPERSGPPPAFRGGATFGAAASGAGGEEPRGGAPRDARPTSPEEFASGSDSPSGRGPTTDDKRAEAPFGRGPATDDNRAETPSGRGPATDGDRTGAPNGPGTHRPPGTGPVRPEEAPDGSRPAASDSRPTPPASTPRTQPVWPVPSRTSRPR